MAPLLARGPREPAGGERQRVALGRALLAQPRLLLLDEPLASIDVARREEVLPYLEALGDQLAIPMVYVSHQFDEVLRLATHVVLLEAGRVLAQGAVNEVSLRPELQSVVGPDLVGAVLEGVVVRLDPDSGSADLAVGTGTLQVSLRDVPLGSRVRLQLLARDVILATQPVQGLSVRNALASTVTAISNDDYGAVLVRLDVGGETVLARITQDALRALKLRPGDAGWTLGKAGSTRGHAFRLAARPQAPAAYNRRPASLKSHASTSSTTEPVLPDRRRAQRVGARHFRSHRRRLRSPRAHCRTGDRLLVPRPGPQGCGPEAGDAGARRRDRHRASRLRRRGDCR